MMSCVESSQKRMPHVREFSNHLIALPSASSALPKGRITIAQQQMLPGTGCEIFQDDKIKIILHTDTKSKFYVRVIQNNGNEDICSLSGMIAEGTDCRAMKKCWSILSHLRTKNIYYDTINRMPVVSSVSVIRDTDAANKFVTRAAEALRTQNSLITCAYRNQDRMHMTADVYKTFFRINQKTLSIMNLPLADVRGRFLNAAYLLQAGVRGLFDASSMYPLTESETQSKHTKSHKFFLHHNNAWVVLPIFESQLGKEVRSIDGKTRCVLNLTDTIADNSLECKQLTDVLKLWSSLQRITTKYKTNEIADAMIHVREILLKCDEGACIQKFAMDRACLCGALASAIVKNQ